MDKLDIREQLQMAREGRNFWLYIEKKYEIDYTKQVIALPHENDIINEYALKNLEEFMYFKHSEEAIILTTEFNINQNIPFGNIKFETVTTKQMDSLMKFNDLYTFSSQMVVVSFTYGCDCDARSLVNNKYITLEEAVCIGILGIPEFGEVIL